jgi:hypothetical protein
MAGRCAGRSSGQRGNLHRGDLAEFEQPSQMQGILRVGLYSVTGRALKLRRSCDNSVNRCSEEEPGQTETCRARLIDNFDRGMHGDYSRKGLIPVPYQTLPAKFAGLTVQGAGYDGSGMDIQAHASTLGHSWNL